MIFRTLFFIFILAPFIVLAVTTQSIWLLLRLPRWNTVPRWFHKVSTVFLGMRVNLLGEPVAGRPTLILSNHISWTDIIAIGSVADVTFVAKSDVAKWFFVSFMASLQRTIYVDRNRKSDAKRGSREIGKRIAERGAVLLFAEGQSDIGTHVLPFRSALVGAAQHAMEEAGAKDVVIQPLTVAYTHLQGLPVGRTDRALIAWIKGKSIGENIREILGGGMKDVTVAFGIPRVMDQSADRKVVTKQVEDDVRRMLVALNRGSRLPTIDSVPAE
jgi:1-acyl-sn-glycerol-3-phosphate acyltransferase